MDRSSSYNEAGPFRLAGVHVEDADDAHRDAACEPGKPRALRVAGPLSSDKARTLITGMFGACETAGLGHVSVMKPLVGQRAPMTAPDLVATFVATLRRSPSRTQLRRTA